MVCMVEQRKHAYASLSIMGHSQLLNPTDSLCIPAYAAAVRPPPSRHAMPSTQHNVNGVVRGSLVQREIKVKIKKRIRTRISPRLCLNLYPRLPDQVPFWEWAGLQEIPSWEGQGWVWSTGGLRSAAFPSVPSEVHWFACPSLSQAIRCLICLVKASIPELSSLTWSIIGDSLLLSH